MGLDGWADWVGRCMDRVYGIRWMAIRAAYWLGRYMDRVYGIRWVDGCIGWTDVLGGRMYWVDGWIDV